MIAGPRRPDCPVCGTGKRCLSFAVMHSAAGRRDGDNIAMLNDWARHPDLRLSGCASQQSCSLTLWIARSQVQRGAWNHFLKGYGRHTRWAGFADVDEFFQPNEVLIGWLVNPSQLT